MRGGDIHTTRQVRLVSGECGEVLPSYRNYAVGPDRSGGLGVADRTCVERRCAEVLGSAAGHRSVVGRSTSGKTCAGRRSGAERNTGDKSGVGHSNAVERNISCRTSVGRNTYAVRSTGDRTCAERSTYRCGNTAGPNTVARWSDSPNKLPTECRCKPACSNSSDKRADSTRGDSI